MQMPRSKCALMSSSSEGDFNISAVRSLMQVLGMLVVPVKVSWKHLYFRCWHLFLYTLIFFVCDIDMMCRRLILTHLTLSGSFRFDVGFVGTFGR